MRTRVLAKSAVVVCLMVVIRTGVMMLVPGGHM